MKYRFSTAIVLVCAALSNSAHAQQSTKTYTYDALGRLAEVKVTGGSQDGEERDYSYDAADNRVQVVSTGATPTPPPPTGSPQDALTSHFAGKAKSGIWDFRSGTTGSTATITNMAGGLGSLVGLYNKQFVAVDPVNGATMPHDLQMEVAAVGNYDLYFLIRKDTADDDGFISAGPLALRFQDNETGSVISGVSVNGVAAINRDELHDAIDDGQFHRVKAANLAAIDHIDVGRSFNGMTGEIIAVVAVERSEFTDLAQTEALITNWFNDISPSISPPPPSPQDALTSHFAGKAKSGIWDFRGGTTGSTASITNMAGGLGSLVGLFNRQFVAVDPVNGATMPHDLQMEVAAVGNYDLYFLIRKDTADDDGFISAGPLALRFQDNETGSVFSGVSVNGVATLNRDELHDAIDDGQFHQVKAASLTAVDHIDAGRTFNGMTGEVIAVVAVERGEFTDLAATETLINNWFNDISP